MGKASSAKKLARAARAGKVGKTRERRDLGFPLVIALVILLGSSLVLYARSDRAEAVAPRINLDHWHSAIGFYNCASTNPGKWEDHITRPEGWPDPTGIHTHNDGMIHIHPFSSSATGSRAKLKVFFETMDVKFSDDEVELTSGVKMTSGTECDGQPAKLKVARFQADNLDQAPQIIESDLANIRFLADREAFTIALVPDGAEIPPPPTATRIDELAGADGGAQPTPVPPTSAPDPSAPTSAPAPPTSEGAPTTTSPTGTETSTTTATSTTTSR